MSSATHRHAPPNVQTHAQQALESYPELLVTGLEHSSQVFALVAESLGQKPAGHGKKSQSSASKDGGIKHAALAKPVGSTYQPQGLSGGEKAAQAHSSKSGVAAQSSGAKRNTVRGDSDILPDSSESPAPTHFYVDFISTGIISLTPPPVLKKHSHDSPSSTWLRRNVINIKISDRDLLAVAIGERVPVKLFSSGRLRIKGDIHKALLLGKLLSVTRSQIYADADEDSPSHDLYDVRPSKAASTNDKAGEHSSNTQRRAESGGNLGSAGRRGELDAEGMQGQGAPAGGAEWGVAGMGSKDMVRAKL
ncbi:hypothetical protein QFC20_002898 [Naganishia adeliensis]|uniref:Uncharacterized protein n=1 Tax=Naganishia adeliensis TaxID=92952 RepID=A0ACC2WH95_9TREE|nr:hypothetical protein QFC20_002898 [Naganishia adeliensis]